LRGTERRDDDRPVHRAACPIFRWAHNGLLQKPHHPGQHKISPAKCFTVIKAGEREEHRSGDSLACGLRLFADIICRSGIEAARHRHPRKEFIEGRSVLQERQIGPEISRSESLRKSAFRRAKRLTKGCEEPIRATLDSGSDHPAKMFQAAGEWMLSANHQAINPLGRKGGHAKADPSAHRVTPEMGFRDTENIENRDNVADAIFEPIGFWIVRLVATAMSPRINHNQAVPSPEGVHVPAFRPVFD
jgi:hypothetical protein